MKEEKGRGFSIVSGEESSIEGAASTNLLE